MWQCHTYPRTGPPLASNGKASCDGDGFTATSVGAKRTTNRVTWFGCAITVSFQPASSGVAGWIPPVTKGAISGFPPYVPPDAADGFVSSGGPYSGWNWPV